MSDIHPDDIAATALVLGEQLPKYQPESVANMVARMVLDAVLPAHDQRLRAQVLNEAADEIEFLFLPPPEFQGSEAVGLLRAANILRAASGERIGAATVRGMTTKRTAT